MSSRLAKYVTSVMDPASPEESPSGMSDMGDSESKSSNLSDLMPLSKQPSPLHGKSIGIIKH